MKKALLLIFLLLALPLAAAQEAGVTQDSMLHGLDRAMERISLMLTLNKAAKSEKALAHAEERLMEAQQLAEEGKEEKLEKAKEQHQKSLQIAEENLAKVKDGKDEEKSEEALETVARIQERIENHYENVVQVKETILERQRESMTEEQISHLEEVFEGIMNKALEMEQKATEKKEQVKAQYQTNSGKSDEEVEAAEDEADNAAGLAQGRQERSDAAIQRAEQALDRVQNMLKEKGMDESQIQAARNALQEARDAEDPLQAMKIAQQMHSFSNEVDDLARQLGQAQQEGNLEQVQEQLKETIQEKQQEHMDEAMENMPEEARERVQDEMNKAEQPEEKAKGKLNLEVMDAPADIADFESLEVTFTNVRIHNTEGFEDRELDTQTVDLTELIGESTSVLTTDLEVGAYNKIEMYVDSVEGILTSGETAVVTVPSNKLMINKGFEIEEGKTTEFVFDINVVKKGKTGGYNLLPVIANSGVKGKIDKTCENDEDCKEGQICEDGKCKGDSSCEDDSDCDADEVCLENKCEEEEEEEETCEEDADCAAGQACIGDECEDVDCLDDEDCADGESCEDYECEDDDDYVNEGA